MFYESVENKILKMFKYLQLLFNFIIYLQVCSSELKLFPLFPLLTPFQWPLSSHDGINIFFYSLGKENKVRKHSSSLGQFKETFSQSSDLKKLAHNSYSQEIFFL